MSKYVEIQIQSPADGAGFVAQWFAGGARSGQAFPLVNTSELLFFAAIGCFAASAAGAWVVVLLGALVCALAQQSVGIWSGDLRTTWNDELNASLVSLCLLGAWLPLLKRRWEPGRAVWVGAAAVPLFWIPQVGDAIANLQGASGNLWIPVPFALAELCVGAWLLRDRSEERRVGKEC